MKDACLDPGSASESEQPNKDPGDDTSEVIPAPKKDCSSGETKRSLPADGSSDKEATKKRPRWPHSPFDPRPRSYTNRGATSSAHRVEGDQSSEAPWEAMFYRLVLYKIKQGDANPPRPSKGNGDEKLYKWVLEQRNRYSLRKRQRDSGGGASGENEFIDDDQIAALEHIGFAWSLVHDRWEKRYKELCEFQLRNGHCSPPTGKSNLGKWVGQQRADYHNNTKSASKRPMTEERKAKLNAIGFVWKISPDPVGWEGRFEELKQFREEHGHCVVPQHYEKNRQLGKWVSKMRYEYNLKKRGTGGAQMTDERIAKLHALGFWDTVKAPRRPKQEKTQSEQRPAAPGPATAPVLGLGPGPEAAPGPATVPAQVPAPAPAPAPTLPPMVYPPSSRLNYM